MTSPVNSRARRAARRAPLWLFASLLLLPCASAAAQDAVSGELRGKVVRAARTLGSDPAARPKRSGRDAEGRLPDPDQPIASESQVAVSGAAVDVRTEEDGVRLKGLTTDDDGQFVFQTLRAGKYILTVTARDYEKASVVVDVFSQSVNDVVVEIYPAGGDPDPRVLPVEPPALMAPPSTESLDAVRQRRNLADARRDGLYLGNTVNDVSLGGSSLARSFDELAFYLPGIAAPPQTLSNFAGPGFGAGIGTSGQFSANGLRSRANNFTVDGSDNNDEDIGVRRQGFLALVPQSIESIYEYQVITALAPAQLGRNLGAQVNVVSQYGTGRVHGSLYGTLSTSLLNAADFFDSTAGDATLPLTARVGGAERDVFVDGRRKLVTNGAGGKDRFDFGQAGGTLGGPLRRSRGERGLKAYYFFSAEFQRLRATKETHFAVPAVEERGLLGTGATGLGRDPFTGAALDAFPTSAQGDAVFSFFPFPNNPAGVYGRNTFTQELPADGGGGVVSARLDGSRHLFDRLHQFIARYNFTRDYRDVPTVGGALFSAVRPKVRAQTFSFYVDSFLNAAGDGGGGARGPSLLLSNQFFVSYGQTRFDFEDRNGTDFLTPTRAVLNDPEDRQFLLNAPLLQNVTRPGAGVVEYLTSSVTAESRLGAPFELIDSPVGQLSVAGFSPVGLDVFTFPQKRTNNTYQLADTLTVQSHAHTAAFGADLRRSELNSRLPRNARPLISFSGGIRVVPTTPQGFPFEFTGRFSPLDMAATGAPNGVFQTLTTGDDSTIGLRYYQLNFFARDQWRARPNLSLSFGLRYEYNTPPEEMHRRIEDTFTSSVLSTVGLDAFVVERRQIFAPDRNNFAPRLGLAFSFGENYRNVLRAGGGLYYDQIPGVVVSQSRNVVPTFITFNTAGLFEFQGSTAVGLGILMPGTLPIGCGDSGRLNIRADGTLNTINPSVPVQCILDVYLINRNGLFGFEPVLQSVIPSRVLEMPTAYHYTASFEREVAADTYVSAAYVGTMGRHLLRQTTPNLGDNRSIAVHSVIVTDGRPRFGGFLGQPRQLDAEGRLLPRAQPLAGTVTMYETSGNSRYDSLQLQVRGRLLRRSNYQLNYTLSRVTDDVSDVFELAGAPALPQNSLTRAGERAPANFDARHVLSGFVTYDLPSAGANTRLKELFLNGWRVTAKAGFQTGQPFTLNTLYDVNGDGNLTDRPESAAGVVATGDRLQPYALTVDPLTLHAADQTDGDVGRNTLRAGSLFQLDLSFLKSFPFKGNERRLALRVDVFNLTNRSNFGIPVRFLEAPGFGRVVNTVTPARRLQFAVRYSF